MSVIGICLVVLVIFVALFGGPNKRRKKAKYDQALNVAALSRPTGPSVRQGRDIQALQVHVGITGQRDEPVASWRGPDNAAVIAGRVIAGGMVYVGSGTGCVIDPELPVAASRPDDTGVSLSYWPSYSSISPESRLAYLTWLSAGKSDPLANIGYVFLYFYGLERRLLVDRPPPDETALLVAEVARLRSIYPDNRSFEGYSRRLIEAVETIRLINDDLATEKFEPDHLLPIGAMPLPLKLAIARKVVANQPLDFELAAAGLIGLAFQTAFLTPYFVIQHARQEFLRLLHVRFDKVFPDGFRLRNRKDSKLRFEYRTASANLSVDLAAGTKLDLLPDPATLTWTKLVDLATRVATDLEPFAKMVAYHPEWSKSLAALVVCPTEFVATTAEGARAWVDELSEPIAAVRFQDLALYAIGATGPKWTIRHLRLVVEALAMVGRGMEPDPRDGSTQLTDDLEVFVFSELKDSLAKSPSYVVATAAASLVAGVARACGAQAEVVESTWLENVRERLGLQSGELLRLGAKLRWLRNTNAGGLAKVKRLLDHAPPEARETVAWSAVVATVAGGMVEREHIAMLEAVYDRLEVPRRGLYAALHGATATAATAALDPVTVALEAPATQHRIPHPTDAERSGLDADRIRRIKIETERVSSVLAHISVEEESPSLQIDDADKVSNGRAGLDPSLATLVERILTRPSWSRAEFETEARSSGLMPDGSLEAINEWAYDQFDEALLEDGEAVAVNAAVVDLMAERADAA